MSAWLLLASPPLIAALLCATERDTPRPPGTLRTLIRYLWLRHQLRAHIRRHGQL